MYRRKTCGDVVSGYVANRHAKQGHKAQRAAWQAGELHALELMAKVEDATPET